MKYNFYSSKILYIWEFTLEKKNHKIEYWDSRLSGKKKLAIDGKVIKFEEDSVNFNLKFKIQNYNFKLLHNEDSKPQLLINDRLFEN